MNLMVSITNTNLPNKHETIPLVMKKRYFVISFFLFLIVFLYTNKDVYYISKLHMYIMIKNTNDTTTVYLSNSRWHLGDNYIKYCPESAEMSNLNLYPFRDTLYAQEDHMEITDIQSKDYNIKPVRLIWVDKVRSDSSDYWSDSTWLKEDIPDWISINHRHGIYKSWNNNRRSDWLCK